MDISTKTQITLAVIAAAATISATLIKKWGDKGQKFIAKCMGIVWGLTIMIIIIVYCLPNPDKRIAKVYRSKISYYESADLDPGDESFEELSESDLIEIGVDNAFSIISSVRNDGEKSSSIEEIRCDILGLEPIEEPIIRVDADIVDDTLKLFAFNDGWGNSDPLIIKTEGIFDEESFEKINDLDTIAQRTYIAEEPSRAPGDAILLAEYKLDSIEFEKSFKGECEIGVIVNEDDIWGATLIYDDNKFYLYYGGGDGENNITTKRFAVLDVDKAPTSLSFKDVTDIPLIDNVMHIVTVVAPTKSCVVECRNIFSINGERQVTDTFKVKVNVPVFAYSASYWGGTLTQELASVENRDKRKMKNIVEKYLYDPYNILDTSSEEY